MASGYQKTRHCPIQMALNLTTYILIWMASFIRARILRISPHQKMKMKWWWPFSSASIVWWTSCGHGKFSTWQLMVWHHERKWISRGKNHQFQMRRVLFFGIFPFFVVDRGVFVLRKKRLRSKLKCLVSRRSCCRPVPLCRPKSPRGSISIRIASRRAHHSWIDWVNAYITTCTIG